MKLTTQTVQVAGRSYQLSGMEEPAHYHHLAEITDRRIRETAAQNPGLNMEACAVAAALSIADELVKAQTLAARLRAQLEGINKGTADEA
ncbi:MAG: cell division protein ZapA [Christensenellales bacterium]|jgi:cell division protein ZapA (FtsZ GTPase activity inhibitor)